MAITSAYKPGSAGTSQLCVSTTNVNNRLHFLIWALLKKFTTTVVAPANVSIIATKGHFCPVGSRGRILGLYFGASGLNGSGLSQSLSWKLGGMSAELGPVTEEAHSFPYRALLPRAETSRPNRLSWRGSLTWQMDV